MPVPRSAMRGRATGRRQDASGSRSRAVRSERTVSKTSQYSPATKSTVRWCTASYAGLVTSPRSKVHAVDGLPVEQPAAHQRTLGLATPVGLLVEVVDAQGVVRGGALEPVPPVGAALGVGVTAGVDDEGVAVPVRLDGEGVVVAVPPVAERAAAEDQEALVGQRLLRSPAAALHVVAADREVGATLGRRRALAPPGRHVAQVRGVEGVGREPQQVQVAVGVAVGQRGDVAVGSVQVHAEPQGRAEPLVVRGRDRGRRSG